MIILTSEEEIKQNVIAHGKTICILQINIETGNINAITTYNNNDSSNLANIVQTLTAYPLGINQEVPIINIYLLADSVNSFLIDYPEIDNLFYFYFPINKNIEVSQNEMYSGYLSNFKLKLKSFFYYVHKGEILYIEKEFKKSRDSILNLYLKSDDIQDYIITIVQDTIQIAQYTVHKDLEEYYFDIDLSQYTQLYSDSKLRIEALPVNGVSVYLNFKLE